MRRPRRYWRIYQEVLVTSYSKNIGQVVKSWEPAGYLPNRFFTKRGCAKFIHLMYGLTPNLMSHTRLTPRWVDPAAKAVQTAAYEEMSRM